ncbi:MAG: hypothetical protein JNL97_11570, partial [Verrucomicrobiales bacterium]|nr:hypothetical protein [Verrucomicrobiales bacterium]
MSLWVILISLSGIASLVAWIGLVNAAFRNGEKNWGIILVVSIFVPLLGPVAAFVFLFKHWNIARIPGLILCASFALLVIGTVGMMLGFKRMAREMVENPEFVAAMRESGMIANPTGAAVDPEPPPAAPSAPETPPTP